MVISRTPFRISFFGGGTDYPAWYEGHSGAVLSTTIDKYCYISLRYLPPFFEHRHRIIYSKMETVRRIDQIQHPVVRVLLQEFKVRRGVEVHHDGDLPARSGVGSSSAFTVGMINSLHALKGKIIDKHELAKEAIHLERDLLKEHVGSQDQVAVAFGGLNRIVFYHDHNFRIDPMTLPRQRILKLQEHLMLVFTGFSRFASEIAAEQVRNTAKKKSELKQLRDFVDRAVEILNSESDLAAFGRLMHESWMLKKRLSSRITNPTIEAMYEKARAAGALGGKVLGAGGGGFMLFFVPPQAQQRLRKALKGFLEVKFAFENEGSRIIYYTPQRF